MSAFVMFRADTVGYGLSMLKSMFTNFSLSIESASYVAGLLSPYYMFILIVALIFAYPIREKVVNVFKSKCSSNVVEISLYIVDVVLLVICIMSLATATYNPFIYFRF